MTSKLLLALAGGIFAATMSNVYAQADDDKKKPKKPGEPPEVQLILSQSDEDTKKPRQPAEPPQAGEQPHAQLLLVQYEDDTKKPKQPEEPRIG